MDVLIATHRHLVEALLLVILLNLFVPAMLRSSPARRVLWTRIGYFAFWAFWSMVLFSGLIVFVFMREPFTPAVIAMLVVAVLLPILDAYRAIRLKALWKNGEEGLNFSMKVLGTEMLLVLAVTGLALR
ncbi:hypothetical protein [Nitratifractor sp.]